MLIKRNIKLLSVALLLLICSGCGFHLRGNLDGQADQLIAQQKIMILSATPYGPLEKALSQSLKQQGATLDFDLGADWQILIESLQISERGVSRDQTGRANEFVLTAELNYQISKVAPNAKSTQLEEPEMSRQISVSANYYQDNRLAMGKSVQQNETRQTLYDKLVARILFQLEHQLRQG